MSTSSLLYLHKKNLSSNDIKSDVDFLLGLLKEEGSKKKRWEKYLDENESVPGDGNLHLHSGLMEQIAYREVMVENFKEEKALLMMWAARFGKLGELHNLGLDAGELEKASYVRKHIHSKLKSDYVREIMEKVLKISLHRENPEDEKFDLVGFFDSLQRRGQMNTALKMLERKSIAQWDQLVSQELFEHLPILLGHAEKYRSAKIYLQKNAKQISHSLANHLEYENFPEKRKVEIEELRSAWEVFAQKN
ncbi:MAG: hypothetical protein HGA61_03310 [Candidatus Moranbacteria bacterium]|nr:hypothetical protein [Candidatus Moranbacteria bacterium]